MFACVAIAYWYFSDRGRFTTEPEFTDDLLKQGLTAAELTADGANTALWRGVEQAHLDRIRSTLTVLPLTVRN